MSESCDGIGRGTCSEPVAWRYQVRDGNPEIYCDGHARLKLHFGCIDPKGEALWYRRAVDVDATDVWELAPGQTLPPHTVRQWIEKIRDAGGDALGIAHDPEALAALDAAKNSPVSIAAAAKARELVNAPINHHTREPNQPSTATIVDGVIDHLDKMPYEVTLKRLRAGVVEFELQIDGHIFAKLPFDNLVKAATRIDPDHTVGSERQIRTLRRETAEARAEMYDWQAKALQLEEKLREAREHIKGLQAHVVRDSSIVP